MGKDEEGCPNPEGALVAWKVGLLGYWLLGSVLPFFAEPFWSVVLTHNMIGAEFHTATNVGSLSFGEKSIGDVARRVNCAIIRCC